MLAALDVRFAFVWGLLAFALNYIPNIGSVLAAIPLLLRCWYLAAFTMRWWFWQAIWSSTWYSEYPRAADHGAWTWTVYAGGFLSLIFWGWLLGPVGMLLSVPLTIIVKIALEQTNGGQSIAVLLSDLNKE
jgi:AI-2 transport protein TqsA